MIESFKHKGLRQLFEDDNARGVSTEQVRKIKQILAVLHAAETIDALRLPNVWTACPEGEPQRLLGGDGPRELADHFSVRGSQGNPC